ncbi:ribonuclease H-like domain-containing protein [Tanacetum coccineum]|uniref:Ribonuclease H-like domain-containing protein n=1 Tax=Tanacetum coccineum TaxID=301880 RepID=A0ABQ5FAY3_9ASTR
MSGTNDENPPPPPPQEKQQTPTQQTPQTVSTIKLPILKKGEYDIWAMKIEHYLAHTDYPIWEVIQNGNGPVSVTTDTSGQIKILPPKTGEEVVARERERKARTTLLMAIPEDHLAKFHKMTDAKEMWNAIKSRFGGNDESKKMQKYILKQQFEGFTVSNIDGIHKGYERFQSLLSQLEIHGAGVSTEDANQKFLRSLPSAWLQVSLIMRNKPGMDSLSFDDLYNNLRVFENDVKGSTASSSNLQNVAFLSENTNSTNEVSTAYGVSNTSGHCSKHEQTSTSSYSLLASQSSCPQLDHEDLDQVDEYDLEEMDLKWQVAMISMRIKKFYKKTGRKLQFDAKEPVGFDKTKVECYNCHKTGHFARECRTKEDNRRRDGWNSGNKDGNRTGKKEESKALVTVDGESVDWTTHSEDDENFAFMASNSSGSDTQVNSNFSVQIGIIHIETLKNKGIMNMDVPAHDRNTHTLLTFKTLMVPGCPSEIVKGHVNFKNLNKLVKGNLVRGLPSKLFLNDHTWLLVKKKATQKLLSKAKGCYEFLVKRDQEGIHNARTPQQNGVARERTGPLMRQQGPMLARPSGTNLVNTVSIPISAASPKMGLSLSETTNSQEDDHEIPQLEDIHEDTTDELRNAEALEDKAGLMQCKKNCFKSLQRPLSLSANQKECYVPRRQTQTGPLKSTTGGGQFYWQELITWQCKKQNHCAPSMKKAKFAAASLVANVL